MALVAATAPDLVVTDLNLGDGSGMGLLRDLATDHPRTRAIVVSFMDNPAFVAVEGQLARAIFFADDMAEAIAVAETAIAPLQHTTARQTGPCDPLYADEQLTLCLTTRAGWNEVYVTPASGETQQLATVSRAPGSGSAITSAPPGRPEGDEILAGYRIDVAHPEVRELRKMLGPLFVAVLMRETDERFEISVGEDQPHRVRFDSHRKGDR